MFIEKFVDEMCFRSGSSNNWTDWEPYDSSRSFNLSDPINNTVYAIYVKFRNKNGESSSINSSIRYLVFPPLDPRIEINNGASNTTSPRVSITIFIENADEMCFKDSSSQVWSDWEPCYWRKTYYITDPINNTEYTVMAKFRNPHGESVVASSSILYHVPASLLVPLNPSIIINDGALYFNSSLLKLSLFASNADQMCFKYRSYWDNWEEYNSTKFVSMYALKNNTTYTISVRFRNSNGNTLPVNDSIMYLAPDSFQDDERDIDGTISFQFYFLIWSLIAMIIIGNRFLSLNKKKSKRINHLKD